MWRAIRQLRLFDVAAIAMCTETPIVAAREFIGLLRRAGVVGAIGDGQFRLIVSSGPKVPMFWHGPRRCVVAGMIDRNDGRAYSFDGRRPLAVPQSLGRWALKRRLKAPRKPLARSTRSTNIGLGGGCDAGDLSCTPAGWAVTP